MRIMSFTAVTLLLCATHVRRPIGLMNVARVVSQRVGYHQHQCQRQRLSKSFPRPTKCGCACSKLDNGIWRVWLGVWFAQHSLGIAVECTGLAGATAFRTLTRKTTEEGYLYHSAIGHRSALSVHFHRTVLQLDIMPHCGCTVLEEAKQALPPFWIVPLTVRVHTTGKSAGEHLQRVELIVRDGRYSWREAITVRFTVQSASKSR